MLIGIEGDILNTAHIVRIEPGRSDPSAALVTFADGTQKGIASPGAIFEKACGVIVPAHPGFVLIEALMPWKGDEEHGVFYRESPIVAFRITPDGGAPYPITVEGEPNNHVARYVVQQPNGTCAGPDGWYETVEEFRTSCDAHCARQAA